MFSRNWKSNARKTDFSSSLMIRGGAYRTKLVPRPGGYLQTIFNWHAPTVSRWVQRFDEQFHDLCQKQNLDPANSRKVAIEQISLRISDYKNKMSTENTESTQPK
jgi:hypothetical protein